MMSRIFPTRFSTQFFSLVCVCVLLISVAAQNSELEVSPDGTLSVPTASNGLGKEFNLFITNRQMELKGSNADSDLSSFFSPFGKELTFSNSNFFSPSGMIYCERKGGNYTGTRKEEFIDKILGSNRNIMFFLHGFRNTPDDALKKADELQKLLDNADRSSGGKVNTVVVPIIWPCKVESWLLIDSEYHTDQYAAEATVPLLSMALQSFFEYREDTILKAHKTKQQLGQLVLQKFNVLAHSMGNFLLYNTLQSLKDNEKFLNRVLFKNSFLAAADIPNDSLEKNQDSAICEFSASVSVYFARDDVALTGSEFANESHLHLSKRLGQTGPSDADALTHNVHYFDCESFNHEYDLLFGHSYFGEEPNTQQAGILFQNVINTLQTGKSVESSPL